MGDLIHGNRDFGTVTYDQAAAGNNYASHSAVVVGFADGSNGRVALTVGGNETDSVRRREVPIDGNGFIRQRTRNPFICVIRTFDSTPA